MKRILFVCHGNICRSVMAEMVLRHMAEAAGRAADFYIESCATSTEEIGNDIYPPAKRCLSAHGITITPHSARQITLNDYDRFDAIYLMDRSNLRTLRWTLPASLLEADAALPQPKIRLLMELCGSSREVADPWYTGDFEATFRDVSAACKCLIHEC